jgi:hypothetical protein
MGLDVPKPLLPTITTDNRIVPLYSHTYGYLKEVTTKVYSILSWRTCRCLLDAVVREGMNVIWTSNPSLSGSLALAGRVISQDEGEDTWIMTALPDSIWIDRWPLSDLLEERREDGALALFTSTADVLDKVHMDGDYVVSVTTKPSGVDATDSRIMGWGAFVIRAGALAAFNSEEKDGPQLGRLDMGWTYIGEYVDLGTPARYIRYHDLRRI